MNRRALTFLIVAILLFIIAGGTLVYVLVGTPNNHVGNNGGSPTANLAQTPIAPPPGNTPVSNKGCGVTKTATGYQFSWLHVANSTINDKANCIVTLKGFNWSSLEFSNGVGGAAMTKVSDESMAWFNQTFHMNVWRIPLNAVWWNENVYVPAAHMNYQAWIQQVVQLAEKYGDYVVLSKGPQFHNPPCGAGSDAPCPSQDQGKKNLTADPAYQQEATTGQYIASAVTMWTSVAKLYANDPAVLYDSWNEMHNISAQTWYQNESTLINTIRAQNPRSLIFIGGPAYNNAFNIVLKGEVPDLSQQNLVYDFHVYDGFTGTYNGKNCSEPLSYVWGQWPNHANEQINFVQQKLGRATSMSEWGGCNNVSDYNQALTSYARAHHISMMYYDETNVFTVSNGTRVLNANGLKVQAAYASF